MTEDESKLVALFKCRSVGESFTREDRQAREILIAEVERLNASIRGHSFVPGQTVECIDAWDTFANLTVGRRYTILDIRDQMVFVRGDADIVGGWWPSHFKVIEETA